MRLSVALPCLLASFGCLQLAAAAVHQATGLKVCEVDATSAIVWTRLTKDPRPVSVDGPKLMVTYAGKQRGAAKENRPDGKPALVFRHFSVDGKVLNEDVLWAK